MRKLFYSRLALSNLKLNRRFYGPYLLTVAIAAAMYYNLVFVQYNRGLAAIGGNTTTAVLYSILQLGSVVVGFFSVIFLFYTHSFLIKQRKQELGLYSVLGMQKKNIARVLFWESALTTFLGLLAGVFSGIVLSKLSILLLCATMRMAVPLGFEISPVALVQTVLLFCGIGILNLFHSLVSVGKVRPIELLRGSSQGEREPKANGLLAVLGIVALGAGYGIAITVDNAIVAPTMFFFAVILVIIGTYCLFISSSVAILRLLRRRKSYYYRMPNFITVSGMMYRMRQNGAGLASICILCTMVLVIFSTTICLNIGMESSLQKRYPYDFQLSSRTGEHNFSLEEMQQITNDMLDFAGYQAENCTAYHYLQNTWVTVSGRSMYISPVGIGDVLNPPTALMITCAQAFSPILGQELTLAPDEMLLLSTGVKYPYDTLELQGKEYRILEADTKNARIPSALLSTVNDNYLAVLPTWEDVQEIISSTNNSVSFGLCFDLPGCSDEEIIAFRGTLRKALEREYEYEDELHGQYSVVSTLATIECRAYERADFLSIYGGLFFIGLFLGTMFVIATALIIYYKQISEGYDDQKRYEIMQKVGMTREEVRQSIGGQIRMVFFLPLLVAVMHLCFAFPIILQLLKIFSLENLLLFAACALCTVLLLTAAYGMIYAITARIYYHIVER